MHPKCNRLIVTRPYKGQTMNKTAIFTISSNNYYAFAKTMLQSVREFHPEAEVDLFFCLVDEKADNKILQDQGLFKLVLAKDIGIPQFKHMAFVYDIVEFNTAVKPFFIQHLFTRGYDKVMYLDPDILVRNRLDAALTTLQNNSIVVTPHQLSPLGNLDHFVPYEQFKWEQSVLQRGTYNLGFLGISDCPESRDFLEWWSNRCAYLCFADPEQGLFVDQKWIDLARSFFPSIFVLRHPGYNMAVWNLHARKLNNDRVNGTDLLVFYHFSSININDPDRLSKHDATLSFRDRPDLIDLFHAYREKVKGNDHAYFSRLPYSYDFFNDGRRITLLERRLFAAVAKNLPDPFGTPGNRFYATVREHRRSESTSDSRQNDAWMVTFAKSCIRILFRLMGAKKYSALVRFFRNTDSFRQHTFLLD